LAQKKMMILLCLGPVRGTLELQPYDEDAEAYEVPTIPGHFMDRKRGFRLAVQTCVN